MQETRYSLRALARLIAYPDAQMRSELDALLQVLDDEEVVPAKRRAELRALATGLLRQDPLLVEGHYVETFDRGRATSLHLFEHVHGDSRERGPAMIDLAQTYEKAGLYLAEGEMPDHLPVVLEFASTQPPREATAFLGEIAHLINVVFNALEKRESRYASLMGALLDLAGEPPRAVQIADEDAIDAVWDEPVAFDGCSSGAAGAGTAPDQPQPVHLVRRAARQAPTPPGATA